jgi:lipopolysaccharide transport system permease protein
MEGYLKTIDSKKTGSLKKNLSDMWTYRELLYFLVWKEIKIRYKQTLLGAAWAILQPLIAMVIFWVAFGVFLGIETDVPYPLFAYSGLVIWIYFSTALNQSSGSILANVPLLTKVYFPRILLPLAQCLVGVIDYCIATIMLIVLMLFFGIMPTLWFPLLVIPFALAILLASGLGFFISSISARYRDVKYVTPFFVQLLLFITPIIYPVTSIPSNFSWIVDINPLTGIIEAQRAFALGTGIVDWASLGYSALVSLALFFLGAFFFSRHERQMADVI